MFPPNVTFRVVLVQVSSIFKLRVFVTFAKKSLFLASTHEAVEIKVFLLVGSIRNVNIRVGLLLVCTDLIDIYTAWSGPVVANDSIIAAIVTQVAFDYCAQVIQINNLTRQNWRYLLCGIYVLNRAIHPLDVFYSYVVFLDLLHPFPLSLRLIIFK